MFKPTANHNKLKTNFRLSISRLKFMEKKKTEMALKARKEIADYISAGKEDRARIRVEHIVREDYLVEAMELVEMYCDLLLARFGLIESLKEIDASIEEAVASIIWATPRLNDIAELKTVSEQLSYKYGKEFAMACMSNKLKNVNEKVMHKLDVGAPPKILVERYMIEIAKSYNVPFEPDATVMRQDEALLGDLMDPASKPFEPLMMPPMMPLPPMGVAGGFSVDAGSPYPPPPPAQPPNMGLGMPYPPPNMGAGGGSYHSAGASSAASASDGFEPPPAYTSMATGGGGGAAALPPKDSLNLPELPNVPQSPSASFNTAGASAPPGAGSEDIDFDDLSRRFDELKRRK